jgi:hypothetical protein
MYMSFFLDTKTILYLFQCNKYLYTFLYKIPLHVDINIYRGINPKLNVTKLCLSLNPREKNITVFNYPNLTHLKFTTSSTETNIRLALGDNYTTLTCLSLGSLIYLINPLILTTFSQLVELEIGDIIGKINLSHLTSLTLLKKLTLNGTYEEPIPTLPWIESLSLNYCSNFTLKGWYSLITLKINTSFILCLTGLENSLSLTEVDLHHCNLLVDISSLLHCKNLSKLTIHYCRKIRKSTLRKFNIKINYII